MEEEKKINQRTKNFGDGAGWKLLFISFAGIFALTQLFDINFRSFIAPVKNQQAPYNNKLYTGQANVIKAVLPEKGITIPVRWGDLGKQMVEKGVIDSEKFESIYSQRGPSADEARGLDNYEKALLYADNNEYIKINNQNAGVVLNLLWAFGLANKNPILEEGPMQDSKYGGADRFASTGGWTLAKGSAMEYYSKYEFVVLTDKQQELVEKVSKNIYRPCCGNSVYFPDCNHGMAMLGLLELMAGQGMNEQEMYKIALQVNSYWFPDTYLTIAKYFEKRGVKWGDIDPKEVLGSLYSSAGGYREILKEIKPAQLKEGSGCGV